MRLSLLPALLLASCVTSQEDPVPPPLSELPAFSMTVCVIMFPGHKATVNCIHGHPCALFGRDMATNKRGEPWENWTCPHRQVKPATTTKRRNP